MNFTLSKTIFLGILANRTILRTLLNYELLNLPTLNGRIIDLGSTKKRSSYYDFLKIQASQEVTSCDLSGADINVDLEGHIPAKEKSFATVLCFNLLEHIYNYGNLISEARRILVDGGVMIGFVPFLLRVHGSPYDHFQKMFSDARFREVRVMYIGRGPLIAAYSQAEILFPRIVKIPTVCIAIVGDYVLVKIRPRVFKGNYPLGYLFVCKK